ncbi:MAG: hypothetical protein HOQ45_02695 [Nocardioidaceae bacterium]|nr:hypothetical protein [Nocardioidaceae bacterium]
MTHEPDDPETVNRESQPNAGGPEGLAGDMGVSSERVGRPDGIEGTGTLASAQGRTDGQTPTVRDEDGARIDLDVDDVPGLQPTEPVDKPDGTAPASGIDRTVGETQPDEVHAKHPFDPSRNPGH